MTDALFNTLCADFEDLGTSDFDSISQHLGAPYLAETVSGTRKQVKGAVWSASLRPVISLSVQVGASITLLYGTRQPVYVHFLYMATSPHTYLSKEALAAMGVEDLVVVGEAEREDLKVPVKINGYRMSVCKSPLDSHFAHLNILGQDFINNTGARVYFGGKEPQFELHFP